MHLPIFRIYLANNKKYLVGVVVKIQNLAKKNTEINFDLN